MRLRRLKCNWKKKENPRNMTGWSGEVRLRRLKCNWKKKKKKKPKRYDTIDSDINISMWWYFCIGNLYKNKSSCCIHNTKNNKLVIAESSCSILVEAWVEKLPENLEVKRIFNADLDPFFTLFKGETLGVVSTSAQSLSVTVTSDWAQAEW